MTSTPSGSSVGRTFGPDGRDVGDTAPLTGIRICDLSRVLAGPYCTGLFADLGAEVIKVEAPPHGDDSRHLGPFRNGASVEVLNRRKKSVALDLKDPSDLMAFYRLVETCDVLVENFRPSVTARLGIDYETVRQKNRGLIYVSISGFGQEGPYADRPAYDLVIQAMSGLMAITGFPGGPPTRVGESMGDLVAALFSSWAISLALYRRKRTGEGTHIDVSMLDCMLALQPTALSQLIATGAPPGRVGNRHPISTPFDLYQARDGLVVIAVANEKMFARLCDLLGRPDLLSDERFATDEARTRNETLVTKIIEQWTASLTVDEVVERATERGVAAAPVWNLAEALSSPHVAAGKQSEVVEDGRFGGVTFVRQPVRFAGWQNAPLVASPEFGQDTESVLDELGSPAASAPRAEV